MEEQHETYIDKSAWSPGPWKDEPDRIEWRDEATGLPCLIVRNNGGALCGYVAVNPGHPLHGKKYSDPCDALQALLEKRMGKPVGNNPGMGLMISMLSGDIGPRMDTVFEVHGGITYTDRCQAGGKICHVAQPGEPDDVWWIGFDCAHSGDVSPAYDSLLSMRLSGFGAYRSVNYVKSEIASLAKQIAEVQS